MKPKTTLILLVIVVAIGLYIKYESKGPSTSEAKRQDQNILNFDGEKLEGLLIHNGDENIELRRQDKQWRLESPIKDQADSSAIENLLANLENWQKDAAIPAKEVEADQNRLSEYGLAKPKLRLKLLGKEMPPEILFGKDGALEGKMYVRFENSKETFLVSQNVRNDLAKKPDEFRDKKLTGLTSAQVARVVLKTPSGEMELQKTGENWEMVKPLRARADSQRVGDLIAQVTAARIDQFVADDRGDLQPYGLAQPRGAITLFAQNDKPAGAPDSSGGGQGQMLQIGAVQEKDKNQVYVRFPTRGFIYTVPKKLEEILNTRPADLRDRRLVRIDTKNLDRLTVDAPSKGKTVLGRKDENWTIVNRNNQPANAAEVNRLLEMLKNEQVVKFVDDVASNLAKYGLDKPQLQLTFSSFATENTPETPAGERPFAVLAFGKVEGETVYARLGDEPFVVSVRRNLLDNIFPDPLQWQELAIFRFKPEQVHRISVVTDRELSFTRGANNEWTWVKGTEPVNQVNVQSLLNTLTDLRAVRWVSGPVPAHAFAKPQATITFTTSPDDKTSHKLLVGGTAGDGMWYARVEGRDGTFVVSNPDFTAFKLPLTGQAAPTPAQSPAPPANPGESPASLPPGITLSPAPAPTP